MELGATVVALCPQRQPFNDEIAKKLGISFPILQDRENVLATAFGLTLETPPHVIAAEKQLGLDLPAHNGTTHWDLPIPARFVLNTNFEIKFMSAHLDHRTRSHPHDCLECIQN